MKELQDTVDGQVDGTKGGGVGATLAATGE